MLDVILDSQFRICTGKAVIDPKNLTGFSSFRSLEHFDLYPGIFVLGVSTNKIIVPEGHFGIVMPRSSYLRCGLHFGSGFVQPGWENTLVLELKNLNAYRPIRLYVGESIAHVALIPSDLPKYQGQYFKTNGDVLCCDKCDKTFVCDLSASTTAVCPQCGEINER